MTVSTYHFHENAILNTFVYIFPQKDETNLKNIDVLQTEFFITIRVKLCLKWFIVQLNLSWVLNEILPKARYGKMIWKKFVHK